MTGSLAAASASVKRVIPAPAKRWIRQVVGAREHQSVAVPSGPSEGMLFFNGVCSICGHHGVFEADAASQLAARAFPCSQCGAVVRFRNEAAVLVDELGRGRHLSLATLLADDACTRLAFYNTGVAGPVRGALRAMTNYVESHYRDGAEPGELVDGAMHQDLQALSFTDDSFDVITSSHVLEHVADPDRAFGELFRVLRPGGRLIFSIPVPWPPSPTSRQRARIIDGEIEHVEPATYHESPEGAPSLVFTDFGTDLLDTLERVGFTASQRRPQISIELAFRDSVFVAMKPRAMN